MTHHSQPGAIEDRQHVQDMFDTIAHRYDLMNRLMTGGQDVRWRRMAVQRAIAAGGEQILDVATGTGDLALALGDAGRFQVVGLDFATEMIQVARGKRGNRDKVDFVVGDAMRMPFDDGTFDACTIAFGLRNLPDYGAGLAEMSRVLKPGGRLVCLELTPFHTPVLGGLFNAYFEHVVPRIGGLLSGDPSAYQYLPASVAAFPDAVTLAVLMRKSGFSSVTWQKLGGGTVALHMAVV